MNPSAAILVRVGIDSSLGGWNAPADPRSGEFVYVPIPEVAAVRPRIARTYAEVLPALDTFCRTRGLDLHGELRFPRLLHTAAMHLDPDFEHCTYGDDGVRRGSQIGRLARGDLLVFYASLSSAVDRSLIYALVGLLTVEEVVRVIQVPVHQFHQNAHTRRLAPTPTDIVVRGMPESSGRLERFIPIGEWRDGAYRARRDVLHDWGGLSVANGYIQRSGRPPRFLDPHRFGQWLDRQEIALMARNN